MSTASSSLFQPIKVGKLTLQHRIALAPLTRFRANISHVHGDLAVEYYGQRASEPGTLLITEATFIAARAGGFDNVPGIWSDEQVEAWKRVTDAVHAKGSFIFLQLWALGRAAEVEQLEREDPSLPYISASNVYLKGPKSTRPLTQTEIKEYVRLYATAASNAVHRAGFDGVEIHGANGYLIDQFLQTNTNIRTDDYGGSIENRSRFGLEVAQAVVDVVGEERTGIRLSPWNTFQDMRMPDPEPTFAYFVKTLKERHPNLAYIHVVEPVLSGDKAAELEKTKPESNDFLREIWWPKPLLSCGGYSPGDANRVADEKGDIVVFGRHFLSNVWFCLSRKCLNLIAVQPDLPYRIRNGLATTPYNRKTFYKRESAEGYTDYPFADTIDAAKVVANL